MEQRTKKLMIMHKALHLRDDIDYMCQEKVEVELRIHQYKDWRNALKKWRKTYYSSQ